jgi:uncharacterized protein YkwD
MNLPSGHLFLGTILLNSLSIGMYLGYNYLPSPEAPNGEPKNLVFNIQADTAKMARMDSSMDLWSDIEKVSVPAPSPLVTPFVTTLPSPQLLAFSTSLPTPLASPKVRVSLRPIVTERLKKIVTKTAIPTKKAVALSTLVTPKPSIAASSVPLKTIAPTLKITAEPVPTTVTAKPISYSHNGDLVFNLVNQYRESAGKKAFLKDERLCKIAQQRAPQLNEEIFGSKKMHEGFKALQLPYWATENIASYQTEAAIVKWWLGDAIHRRVIDTDYTHSCAACYGKSCSQIFSSFVPK